MAAPPVNKRAKGAHPNSRLRSLAVHNDQRLGNWWTGDHGRDDQAPVDLLSRMSKDEFFEDPYAAEPGKDVSFDRLPAEVKDLMLRGLAAAEPGIHRRTVRAPPTAGAVVVPPTHRHEMLPVPDEAIATILAAEEQTVGEEEEDDDDGFGAGPSADGVGTVKPQHHAYVMGLRSYMEAERVFAQIELGTMMTGVVSIGNLCKAVGSIYLHAVHGIDKHGKTTMFHTDTTGASSARSTGVTAAAAAAAAAAAGASSEQDLVVEEDEPEPAHRLLAVFELDDHGVFYCAVVLRPERGTLATYDVVSPAEKERLHALRGTYMSRWYFSCPCV